MLCKPGWREGFFHHHLSLLFLHLISGAPAHSSASSSSFCVKSHASVSTHTRNTVLLACSLQLILDMRAARPPLIFFLLAYVGASASFYVRIVGHSAPLAVLRVGMVSMKLSRRRIFAFYFCFTLE